MKQNFINDLYYARYRPYERKVQQSAEMIAVNQRIEKERAYFLEKLSPEDCRRFQELEDLFARSSGYHSVDAFGFGLRYGAYFMDAILAEDKEEPPEN